MKDFTAYIEETIAELEREERMLANSDRKDEANLIKVKINICGICKTFYDVVGKTKTGEAFYEEYLKKLATLPNNWKEAYEKAKAHNDVEKIVIEEIKLDTLETVKNKFVELWEQKQDCMVRRNLERGNYYDRGRGNQVI